VVDLVPMHEERDGPIDEVVADYDQRGANSNGHKRRAQYCREILTASHGFSDSVVDVVLFMLGPF
jgi:hypothetical protein